MPEIEDTVKSRLHHGSNSLDLTIPSEVVRTFRINPGDVFRLVAKDGNDSVILCYERVYTAKSG